MRGYVHPCLCRTTRTEEHATTLATTLTNVEESKQIKQADGRKWEAYTVFTDEDRAEIGKHAATTVHKKCMKKLNLLLMHNAILCTSAKFSVAYICDPTVAINSLQQLFFFFTVTRF